MRARFLSAFAALALSAAPPALADAVVSIDSIRSGADASDRVQLYAPNPAQSGSSISHWDLATSPLLMWPSISDLLAFHQTDLTVPLFLDLGYTDGTFSFSVQYLDPPGFGFNETDAAPPAPGNPGATYGEQRRHALEQALAKWASMVGANQPVKVLAVHLNLFCDATSAVLASSGPTCVYTFVDADENPVFNAGTMLAEHLDDHDTTTDPEYACTADFDDDGDQETGDIIVYVNENIDYDNGCLGGAGYYYGQDTGQGDAINFSNVLLHELGHGIGFSSFTVRNPASPDFGEWILNDVPGVFDLFVLDNETGKRWTEMTNGEREDSIENGPHVVWDGDNVVADASAWAVVPSVLVSFPEGGGEFPAAPAAFGPPTFGDAAVDVTGLLAVASPGTGCSAIGNVAGKWALIERGTCNFIDKYENAVAGGAIGVIVYNSAAPSSGGPEDLVFMAGTSDNTTVPALFVRRSSGLELKDLVQNGPSLSCAPTAGTACLLGGRFAVSVNWETVSDGGLGQVMSFNGARAESDQSVFFWFFNPENFEMGIKMVDACSFNDSFWVFVSGLTNQGFTVTILDTFTGQVRLYSNPLGTYPQTIGATNGVQGFDCTPTNQDLRVESPTPSQVRQVLAGQPADPLGEAIVSFAPGESAVEAACVADADTACHLLGRFQVEVEWQTVSDSGAAQVMTFGGQRASSDQSSFWWFFDPANFEMGVKMVDACVPPFNKYWAFVSGLTNQYFRVHVTDTLTGAEKFYSNPLGQYPQTVGDTSAFECTP